MSHAHTHQGHDHHGGPTPERALWVALALNAAFLVLEAAVGWWTGSLALLSDAGHMLSDVGALAIALVAVRLSERAASSSFTFGLRRAPVLGGLVNAASLIVIVVLIGVEAVERFRDPPDLQALPVFWTGVAGLAINLGSAWYLARSRDESVNTRGAMLHLLSDALGSVAAIVSAVAIGLYGAHLADPIASIVIAALILVGSWPLLRETVRILLQGAPSEIDAGEVRALIEAHERVLEIEDFHLWGLDAGQPVLSTVVVAQCTTVTEANELADELRGALDERFGVEHATIECRDRDAQPIEECR